MVADVRVGGLAVGGVGKNPFRLEGSPRGVDVFMDSDYGQVVVIEPGATQLGIGKIKAEGLYQMKFGPGNGGQTNGIARIARDFWSVEEDAEHCPILVSPVRAGRSIEVDLVHSAKESRQDRHYYGVWRGP